MEKLGPDVHKLMDEKLARSTIENAMKVLFYRDARSLNKVSLRQFLLQAVKLTI